MKGYKGFSKGLVCRDKQYAENTVFEEKKAVICCKGMHFCENPFDVLDYYPLLGGKGEPNEFTEVEALAEVKTDDNRKYCTTKLKIGAKLDFAGFVKACFDFVYERATKDMPDAASGYNSKLAASGYNSQLAASGCSSKLAASGYNSKLAASGDNSKLAASGDNSQLAASGCSSKLAASGYNSKLAASGDNSQLAASGDNSQLAASGCSSKLAASGYNSKLAASGYNSQLAASGDNSQLAASGADSVVAGIGVDNKAKASAGSWITLAEWKWSDKKDRYIPVCVKTEYVDGERIKEDTFYILEGGEFKEWQ